MSLGHCHRNRISWANVSDDNLDVFPKDFDDDGILDRKDLEKLVNCLTGEGDETRLSESEMDQLIQNVSATSLASVGLGLRARWTCCVGLLKQALRAGVSLSLTDPGGVRY